MAASELSSIDSGAASEKEVGPLSASAASERGAPEFVFCKVTIEKRREDRKSSPRSPKSSLSMPAIKVRRFREEGESDIECEDGGGGGPASSSSSTSTTAKEATFAATSALSLECDKKNQGGLFPGPQQNFWGSTPCLVQDVCSASSGNQRQKMSRKIPPQESFPHVSKRGTFTISCRKSSPSPSIRDLSSSSSSLTSGNSWHHQRRFLFAKERERVCVAY